MEDRRSLLWLKAAFLVGAITDALALVPMLCPKFTEILWGLDGLNGSYIFAMGYGATLMFGWTLLLIWAYQKPLERRFVAFFTLLVVIGLAATEIISIMYGIISIGKIIPTIILQILIAVLFGFSFVNSRKTE